MEGMVTEISMAATPMPFSHSTTDGQKAKTVSSDCQICGAPAVGCNYGVISCSSCKMFFKRNSELRQKHFQCRFGGHCQVNIYTRRTCASCRLGKCFKTGMQTELLRSSRSTKSAMSRKKKVVTNSVTKTSTALVRRGEREQPEQFPTLNLLRSDKSSLSATQWILLSRLIHSYDEGKLLSIAHRLLRENNTLEPNKTFDPTLAREFFMELYETAGAYLRSNGDLCTLSWNDRSALLRGAADCVTCLGTVFVWSHSQLHKHRPFVNDTISLYGEISVAIIQRTMKFIDPDVVLVKLALSLFAFSNSITVYSPNMAMKPTNTRAIFEIQNSYALVTWGYLVYRYGYDQAVIRFTNLIQCLLAATDTVTDAQTIRVHTNDIELLVEQTELTLTLDDIERPDSNPSEPFV